MYRFKKILSTVIIICLIALQSFAIDFSQIKKTNVLMINRSKGSSGSATIIKYKEEIYVLCCFHQVISPEDEIIVIDDFGTHYLKPLLPHPSQDLMLLKFKDEVPENIVYSELSEEDFNIGDKIYIIGNPAGQEDVVTSGIITGINEKDAVTDAKVFFGNSGGGVYNEGGKLIGIAYGLTSIKSKDIEYSLAYFVHTSAIEEVLANYNMVLQMIESLKEKMNKSGKEPSDMLKYYWEKRESGE